MYDLNLLLDPDSGEELVSVTTKTAAEFLHAPIAQVQAGLQQKTLPIGWATVSPTGKWCYTILSARLKAYAMAGDISA